MLSAFATLLRYVATCWVLKTELVPNCYRIMQHQQMLPEKFDQFQILANNTQHVATRRNISQKAGQTRSRCCAQQGCDKLRSNVAIVWPELAGGNSY